MKVVRQMKAVFVMLVIVVGLLLASPGHAQFPPPTPYPTPIPVDVPVFSDLIIISGFADIVDSLPDPPGPPPTPPPDSVRWIDDNGHYAFACGPVPPLTGCFILSAPGPDAGGADVLGFEAIAFGSTGSFVNIVCGTGIVDGDPTIVPEPKGPAPDETYSVDDYDIVFVGGRGILTGTVTEDTTGSPYPATAVGAVSISAFPALIPPDPTASDLGPCATGFTVVGAVVIVESPFVP